MIVLGPGKYFGEISLLVDIPRTASMVALDNSLLLELSKADYLRMIKLIPELRPAFDLIMKVCAAKAKRRIVRSREEEDASIFQNLRRVCLYFRVQMQIEMLIYLIIDHIHVTFLVFSFFLYPGAYRRPVSSLSHPVLHCHPA
jgi:CRP-like cAMP-binding protein